LYYGIVFLSFFVFPNLPAAFFWIIVGDGGGELSIFRTIFSTNEGALGIGWVVDILSGGEII